MLEKSGKNQKAREHGKNTNKDNALLKLRFKQQ